VKQSPAPRLIRALTELRDVLKRGEHPGLHFKKTTRRADGSIVERNAKPQGGESK